jgi:hypothetical protein
MFVNDEKSKILRKKLAKRIKTSLFFVKALPFKRNFAKRPRDRKKYVSPFRVLIVGKNFPRVKFNANIFVGL